MAETFTWGSGGEKLTPSERRRKIAEAMILRGTSTAPIQHWTQGAARVAEALLGGWESRQADEQDKRGQASVAADAAALMGGGASAPVAPASTSPPADISTAPDALLPRFAQAEAQYGLPPNFLAQTAKVESNFNPNAANPNSSARGLFQFTKGTARDYGLANPMDPIASTDAAARLAADNSRTLTRALGRAPTGGELYLAHQQGGGGAAKLLANPNARAIDVVGRDAVLLNGGHEGMTAGEFARKWTQKVAQNEADMPAPDAMPAEAPIAPAGFVVPPAEQASPAMTAQTFNAIQDGQPLDPAFVAEGVAQPWMGTAIPPQAAQPAVVAQAPMPPPRPADLPAPGAVEATGRMPVPAPAPQPQVMPDLSNSPDGGMRELQVLSEQQRQGQQPAPEAAASPLSRVVAAFTGGGQQTPSAATSPAVARVAEAAATPAAPAPASPAVDRVAAAMRVLNSPYAQPGQRAIAQMVVQQAFRDPTESEMKRLQIEKARREAEAAPLAVEGQKLDIETKRKNLGKADAPTVQRIKQPDGSEVAVQWDQKSGAWVPLVAPEGGNAVKSPGKLTEQQSKDVGFYNRGSKIIDRLDTQDTALKDTLSALGGNVSNYLKSDAYRQAEQTGRELLAIILRKDTGAAVTDKEMELYGNIYLPEPGDDDQTVAQKRFARRTALEGLKMGLGPAEILFNSQNTPAPAPIAPAAAQPAPVAPDRAALEAEARRRGLIK